jgi:hypothetical protein
VLIREAAQIQVIQREAERVGALLADKRVEEVFETCVELSAGFLARLVQVGEGSVDAFDGVFDLESEKDVLALGQASIHGDHGGPVPSAAFCE